MRVWVLTGHDPATGCATRPVAVAGVDADHEVVSWIPLEHLAAHRWRSVLATATRPLADTLEYWVDASDGISLNCEELTDPPPSPDLHGVVEAVVDRQLAEER